jgi:hypothetical protein
LGAAEMLHLAQRLLARIDTFLEAPIPSWTKYNNDQSGVFGDEAQVESKFQRKFGVTIPEDYLDFFETELNKFADWIRVQHNCGSLFNSYIMPTHVVECEFAYELDTIRLSIIRVRPCAAGLRIMKVILFWIGQNCNPKQSLSVCTPLSRTAPELLKISKNFRRVRRNWILEQPTAAEYMVDKKVRVVDGKIQLIRGGWPSASELNDQAAVDKRFPAVQPQAESTPDVLRLPDMSEVDFLSEYFAHFEELIANENNAGWEQEPWFGDVGTEDEVERFEIRIHADSSFKPKGVIVMYRDKEHALFMHLDGRRYRLHNFHGAFRPKLLNESWTLRQGDAPNLLVFNSTTAPNRALFSMKASNDVFYFENANAPLGTFYPDATPGSYKGSDDIAEEYTFIDIDRQGRCFTHSKITYAEAASLICSLSEASDLIEMVSEATKHLEFSIGAQNFVLKHDLKVYTKSSSSAPEYLGRFHQFRYLKALLLSALQPIPPEHKRRIHTLFEDAVPLEGILNLQVGTREADLWPLDDRTVILRFMQRNEGGSFVMYLNPETKVIYVHGPGFKAMTVGATDCTVMDAGTGRWSINSGVSLMCERDKRRPGKWPIQNVIDKFDFEARASPTNEILQRIELTLDHTRFKVQLLYYTTRYVERPIPFSYVIKVVRYNCYEDNIKFESDDSMTICNSTYGRGGNGRLNRYLNIKPDLTFRFQKSEGLSDNACWKEMGQLYSVHDLAICMYTLLKTDIRYNESMENYNVRLQTDLESYFTPDHRNGVRHAIEPNEPPPVPRTEPDTQSHTFTPRVSDLQFSDVSATFYPSSEHMCLEIGGQHYRSVDQVRISPEKLKAEDWKISEFDGAGRGLSNDRTYYKCVLEDDREFIVQSQRDLLP